MPCATSGSDFSSTLLRWQQHLPLTALADAARVAWMDAVRAASTPRQCRARASLQRHGSKSGPTSWSTHDDERPVRPTIAGVRRGSSCGVDDAVRAAANLWQRLRAHVSTPTAAIGPHFCQHPTTNDQDMPTVACWPRPLRGGVEVPSERRDVSAALCAGTLSAGAANRGRSSGQYHAGDGQIQPPSRAGRRPLLVAWRLSSSGGDTSSLACAGNHHRRLQCERSPNSCNSRRDDHVEPTVTGGRLGLGCVGRTSVRASAYLGIRCAGASSPPTNQ